MGSLLVTKVDVFRWKNNQPSVSFNQEILVEGNLIRSISPTGTCVDPLVRVVKGDGMLAIPGMINSHAHVPMVLFRGVASDVTIEDWFNDYVFPLESNLTPEDVYWGALLGIAEMIQAGITNVADHYFYMDQVAQAIEESGIRGNLAWAVFEHEGNKKLDQTVDFIQRWQGKADGRIKTWLGPHSPYLCGPEFLKLCAKTATELGVGIHLHVSETADQVALSIQRYGVTPVHLLLDTGILEQPNIFAHCLYPTKEDLDIMANHPVGVAQAPKTYLWAAMGLARLKNYQVRGIPIGLATDGAASSSTLDLFEQMRLTALTQKHLENDSTTMSLDQVLNIAFRGGANVVRESELGELEPGKLADMVLLKQDRALNIPRLNPVANLVYNLSAGDVDTVICNGHVVMQDRKLLTLDLNKIKKEVESRLDRLSRRIPGKHVAVYPT